MKIELEIPDEWVDKRHIYIMTGIEVFAYQFDGQPLMVKTSRCIRCGKCCEKCECEFLVDDGPDKRVCSKGLDMPVCCSLYYDPNFTVCSQKFEAR